MRPTTLLGLIVRAAALRRRRLGCWLLIALLLYVLLRMFGCGTSRPRFATFNIENYPKSERQEAGAFDAIRSLGVSAVAAEEITDPARFGAAAKARLGAAWALTCTDRPMQRVCVLYDGNALELVAARSHSETEVYAGAKPALEAELREIDGVA